MTATSEYRQHVETSLQGYIQSDTAVREGLFPGFVRALNVLVEHGREEECRSWVHRAVSPCLDYSSLMKLRRYLPAGDVAERSRKLPRLAIVGGPTTVQLRQIIEIFLAGEGLAAEIYEADFGLFRQEILTPSSALDQFQPEVLFIATGAREIARYPTVEMTEESVAQMAEAEVRDWLNLWDAANSKWNATVIQNNFELGPASVLGHYGLRHPAAREHYLERLNRLFADRAPAYVILHDLRSLAAESGARSWFDSRFYFEFKLPCGPDCLIPYGHSVVSLVRAILGRSKKVVAVDLDNTLWGGVVGDVGSGEICLGQGSGEGEAYLAFQTYLRDLQQRGVVLAVCSKNDIDKAREPFEKREDMILTLQDISCFVANWDNKADNLRAIATQLDLRLDSFVFVDDNPAERALVRRLLPEVEVPDMPADPAGYIQALAMHRYFETTSFTREDSARGRYYADNARRKELISNSYDLNSFLDSLGMRMAVSAVNDMNTERVTQLINKSNQFNLTTRRYTLAQVREITLLMEWRTLTFSLRDNLGDNGLISVVFARKQSESLVMDSWVMSCRVLQRGVEQFVRNELVRLARHAGCVRVLGTYIPTAKNSMVKNIFGSLGFTAAGADGEVTFWSLNIEDAGQPLSTHIIREQSDA
jgi:FkbH-like protein